MLVITMPAVPQNNQGYYNLKIVKVVNNIYAEVGQSLMKRSHAEAFIVNQLAGKILSVIHAPVKPTFRVK